MIKAALQKVGVDPNSIKLLAMPFPTMRAALRNGQVDAIWMPEPFLSQALNLDGARIVMAPGPVLGKFWPIGGYARADGLGRSANPAPGEEVPHGDQPVAHVRAEPSGRDPRTAAGRYQERAPADLEPDHRPREAAASSRSTRRSSA